MAMRQVRIQVDPLGNIKSEAEGFVGQACEEATAKIFQGLGGKQDDSKKDEYYQSADAGTVSQRM